MLKTWLAYIFLANNWNEIRSQWNCLPKAKWKIQTKFKGTRTKKQSKTIKEERIPNRTVLADKLPCYLIIFIKTRDHQHLLKELWTLGQSIESSWLHNNDTVLELQYYKIMSKLQLIMRWIRQLWKYGVSGSRGYSINKKLYIFIWCYM